MRKIITTLFVTAALCTPSVALAGHGYDTDLDPEVMDMTFDSEEECEEELAQQRRALRAEYGYQGRDRGQSNKAFNQRYSCEYDEEEDAFVIEDSQA